MARPIIETLRELRNGAVLEEASEALADVVRAVSETSKAAVLTIKLTVKPAGRGSTRTVMVEASVGTKIPTPDQEVTVFFPLEDGNLSRQDPSQIPLGLRPVERLDTASGEITRVPKEPADVQRVS